MSWYERDYHKADSQRGPRAVLRRMGLALPPACTVLALAHALAFVVVLLSRPDVGSALAGLLRLGGGPLRAAAILTHPFATAHPVPLGLTLVALIWLAARLERYLGRWRLLGLYVAGNVAAGVAYYAYSWVFPRAAGLALSFPAGALAAWCGAAWLSLRDQYAPVFGQVRSLGRTAAIGGAAVFFVVIMLWSAAATAWAVAVIAACGAGLLVQGGDGRFSAAAARLRGMFHGAWARLRRGLRGAGARPAGSRSAGPTVRDRLFRRRSARRSPTNASASAQPDTEIDAILSKIGCEGLASLTPRDRERLEAARRRMIDGTQEQG